MKRSPNFSDNEKFQFVSILKRYSHLIECKKTDANSLKIKQAAWKSLENEFNSIETNNKRSMKQLIRLWETMMSNEKKVTRVQNKKV